MKSAFVLATVLALATTTTACKKKAEGDSAKGTPTAAGETAAPEAAKPKLPEMAALEIPEFGITLNAPTGSTVEDLSAYNAEDEIPGSADVITEKGCEANVDLYVHPKSSFDTFYNNAKTDDGLTGLKFTTDEKTDAGFKVAFNGDAPIGKMFGVSTGTVVGDQLILCSSGFNRMTAEEAACIYAVCSSIAAK